MFEKLSNLDRRIIYFLLILAVTIPLIFRISVPPARMVLVEDVYRLIEGLPADGFALIATDFGPGTQAENQPQAEAVIEHLLRRRIPIVVFTRYALGERFSIEVPKKVAERLKKEDPNLNWEYGVDWISLGYRPASQVFIQSLAQENNLAEFLATDAVGKPISSFEKFGKLRTLKDFLVVGEFTGLVGMLSDYIQFLQRADYIPPLIHGCTSITIPETYIYRDSGQLKGVLEGFAGAAWYSELLRMHNPKRTEDKDLLVINTSLGIAQIAIILLVFFGNLVSLGAGKRKKGGVLG